MRVRSLACWSGQTARSRTSCNSPWAGKSRPRARLSWIETEHSMKKEIGISALLVVLCVVTSILNPRFLLPANLMNLYTPIGIIVTLSSGLEVVIITGGIDLSPGSMFALQGVLLPMAIIEWHWPWPVAAVCAVLLPMVMGAV